MRLVRRLSICSNCRGKLLVSKEDILIPRYSISGALDFVRLPGSFVRKNAKKILFKEKKKTIDMIVEGLVLDDTPAAFLVGLFNGTRFLFFECFEKCAIL